MTMSWNSIGIKKIFCCCSFTGSPQCNDQVTLQWGNNKTFPQWIQRHKTVIRIYHETKICLLPEMKKKKLKELGHRLKWKWWQLAKSLWTSFLTHPWSDLRELLEAEKKKTFDNIFASSYCNVQLALLPHS